MSRAPRPSSSNCLLYSAALCDHPGSITNGCPSPPSRMDNSVPSPIVIVRRCMLPSSLDSVLPGARTEGQGRPALRRSLSAGSRRSNTPVVGPVTLSPQEANGQIVAFTREVQARIPRLRFYAPAGSIATKCCSNGSGNAAHRNKMMRCLIPSCREPPSRAPRDCDPSVGPRPSPGCWSNFASTVSNANPEGSS